MSAIKSWIAKNILHIPHYDKMNYMAEFIYDGQHVEYAQVSGFFAVDGHIFYKSDKGSVGRSLEHPEKSFTAYMSELNPTKYKNVSITTIGKLRVCPLKVLHVHNTTK